VNVPRVVNSQPLGYKCTAGVCADEAIELLKKFYSQGNPNGKKNKDDEYRLANL
jgi:hypothetical protein